MTVQYIRFYSLSDLKTDKTTPHPAATLPFIHIHNLGDSARPTMVFHLEIVGDYVLFEIRVERGDFDRSYYIDVHNWKTGQMVSVRIPASPARMWPSLPLDVITQCSEPTWGRP